MPKATNLRSEAEEEEAFGYLIERASVAIGRLDAHVSASPVASAWQLRAAWTGYAKGLQLHGVEIDEIDVFSWGSGICLPGRPRLHTVVDHFAGFAPWRARLAAKGRHWAEDLPFNVKAAPPRNRQPDLVRAIELQLDYLTADRSMAAWLTLPVLLHRMRLTESPLPCLVAGDRHLLFNPRDRDPAYRRILRSLEASALAGRHALKAIEDAHVVSIAALRDEHRPTALRRLAALLILAPIQSPESVKRHLKMTLSGAGKLLSRAAALGMAQEVSGRRAWRTYATPDIAVALGFVAPPKGRPPARPLAIEPDRPLASILADFDREMAAFDVQFAKDRL